MYSRVQTRYCRPYSAKGTHNLTLTHTHMHTSSTHRENNRTLAGQMVSFKNTRRVDYTAGEALRSVCDRVCLETLGNTKQWRYAALTIQRAGVHYYGG